MVKKFEEKIEKQICDEYKKGLSSLRLAKKYSCNKRTILRILIRHDIDRRNASESHKGIVSWRKGLRKLNLETEIMIGSMYLGGATLEQIADYFLVSRGNVWNILIRNNINRRTRANCGEKNGRWLGGKSFEPYGPEFNNELKEQIRKRDRFRCQECFRHQIELKRKLDVHHIDFDKQNNNENNLISLCNVCHSQTLYDRQNWIGYYQKRLKGLV